MNLLCIDPGTTESGVVIYDGEEISFRSSGIDNHKLLNLIKLKSVYDHIVYDHMAIEMIASYGMSVGQSVFETCVWIGRFIEAFQGSYTKVYRKDVKMCLCQSMRAKDTNIRQAILDRFPATGGGKTPQIGTKNKPGPLYRISSHAWSALAIGITYFEDPTSRTKLGDHK